MVGKGNTGKGVVVGIIDTGLEFTHVNFRDADGNLRIKRVWKPVSYTHLDVYKRQISVRAKA